MRRTNRVEPVSTGNNANDLARATMTTTTRMEFVRRVQVLPMEEAVTQLHGDLNQSLAGEVTVSPRIWTGMQHPAAPVAIRSTRRAIWLVGCLFITVGLLALVAMVVGLAIAFGTTNAIGESNIERYDMGDLHYGVNNIDGGNFPPNTYLSGDNKAVVQKYLSNQLYSEPGYRGLFIDGVLVQHQSESGRKRRDTSCDGIFIVRNIQVYFDHCSTCAGSRNLALRRALSNITILQAPLELLIDNSTMSKVAAQICSTPTINRLIVPVRLSILQEQKINSSLLSTATYPATIPIQSNYPTSTYSTRPSSGRSSYIFTPRGATSQKTSTVKTITTTAMRTSPYIVTSSPLVTTVISTVAPVITTDSALTTEPTVTEKSTKQTDTSTLFNEIDQTTVLPIDESTLFASTATTVSEEIQSTTWLGKELTTTEESEVTTTILASEQSTSPFDQTSIVTELEETTYATDVSSPTTESVSMETSTTAELDEVTSFSSPSSVELTSEEASTVGFLENTTTTDETTVNDSTTELDIWETTVASEETSSDALPDVASTTDEMATDFSTETQSSTMSSDTEETPLTNSTHYSTAFLPTSTMEQYYTFLSSTDTMTIGSTAATIADVEILSSTISTEEDSSSPSSLTPIDLEQTSVSSDEYLTTEPLLVLDSTTNMLTDSSTNDPQTTSLKLNTTTPVVSTAGMIVTSSLPDNLTEQESLPSLLVTTVAPSTGASVESSSSTPVSVNHLSTQSTGTSSEDQSLSTSSTTISNDNPAQDTTLVNHGTSSVPPTTQSMNTDPSSFPTDEQSSNSADIDLTSSIPTTSVGAVSTELLLVAAHLSTSDGSSAHTLIPTVLQEQPSTSTQYTTATSTDIQASSTALEMDTASISPEESTTDPDRMTSTNPLTTVENVEDTTSITSSSPITPHIDSSVPTSLAPDQESTNSQAVSVSDLEVTQFVANTYSIDHLLSSTSQSATATDMIDTTSDITSSRLIIERSSEPTSAADVSLYHTITSMAPTDSISTLPLATKNENYMSPTLTDQILTNDDTSKATETDRLTTSGPSTYSAILDDTTSNLNGIITTLTATDEIDQTSISLSSSSVKLPVTSSTETDTDIYPYVSTSSSLLHSSSEDTIVSDTRTSLPLTDHTIFTDDNISTPFDTSETAGSQSFIASTNVDNVSTIDSLLLSSLTSTVASTETGTTTAAGASDPTEYLSSPTPLTNEIPLTSPSSNSVTNAFETTADVTHTLLTLSSTTSTADDVTTSTPLLTHYSTDINNDLTSTSLSSPTSSFEQIVNDEFNTLSSFTDHTNLSSTSTFQPLTPSTTSVNTLTSDLFQAQQTMSQSPNVMPSSSPVLETAEISTIESDLHSTIAETSPEVPITTTHTSSSTQSPSDLYSNEIDDTTTETVTQLIPSNNDDPVSVQSGIEDLETSTIQTVERTRDFAFATSVTPATMIETLSSFITTTSASALDGLTTTSIMFNDELLPTLTSDRHTFVSPEISTNLSEKSSLIATSLPPSSDSSITYNDDQSTVPEPASRSGDISLPPSVSTRNIDTSTDTSIISNAQSTDSPTLEETKTSPLESSSMHSDSTILLVEILATTPKSSASISSTNTEYLDTTTTAASITESAPDVDDLLLTSSKGIDETLTATTVSHSTTPVTDSMAFTDTSTVSSSADSGAALETTSTNTLTSVQPISSSTNTRLEASTDDVLSLSTALSSNTEPVILASSTDNSYSSELMSQDRMSTTPVIPNEQLQSSTEPASSNPTVVIFDSTDNPAEILTSSDYLRSSEQTVSSKTMDHTSRTAVVSNDPTSVTDSLASTDPITVSSSAASVSSTEADSFAAFETTSTNALTSVESITNSIGIAPDASTGDPSSAVEHSTLTSSTLILHGFITTTPITANEQAQSSTEPASFEETGAPILSRTTAPVLSSSFAAIILHSTGNPAETPSSTESEVSDQATTRSAADAEMSSDYSTLSEQTMSATTASDNTTLIESMTSTDTSTASSSLDSIRGSQTTLADVATSVEPVSTSIDHGLEASTDDAFATSTELPSATQLPSLASSTGIPPSSKLTLQDLMSTTSITPDEQPQSSIQPIWSEKADTSIAAFSETPTTVLSSTDYLSETSSSAGASLGHTEFAEAADQTMSPETSFISTSSQAMDYTPTATVISTNSAAPTDSMTSTSAVTSVEPVPNSDDAFSTNVILPSTTEPVILANSTVILHSSELILQDLTTTTSITLNEQLQLSTQPAWSEKNETTFAAFSETLTTVPSSTDYPSKTSPSALTSFEPTEAAERTMSPTTSFISTSPQAMDYTPTATVISTNSAAPTDSVTSTSGMTSIEPVPNSDDAFSTNVILPSTTEPAIPTSSTAIPPSSEPTLQDFMSITPITLVEQPQSSTQPAWSEKTDTTLVTFSEAQVTVPSSTDHLSEKLSSADTSSEPTEAAEQTTLPAMSFMPTSSQVMDHTSTATAVSNNSTPPTDFVTSTSAMTSIEPIPNSDDAFSTNVILPSTTEPVILISSTTIPHSSEVILQDLMTTTPTTQNEQPQSSTQSAWSEKADTSIAAFSETPTTVPSSTDNPSETSSSAETSLEHTESTEAAEQTMSPTTSFISTSPQAMDHTSISAMTSVEPIPNSDDAFSTNVILPSTAEPPIPINTTAIPHSSELTLQDLMTTTSITPNEPSQSSTETVLSEQAKTETLFETTTSVASSQYAATLPNSTVTPIETSSSAKTEVLMQITTQSTADVETSIDYSTTADPIDFTEAAKQTVSQTMPILSVSSEVDAVTSSTTASSTIPAELAISSTFNVETSSTIDSVKTTIFPSSQHNMDSSTESSSPAKEPMTSDSLFLDDVSSVQSSTSESDTSTPTSLPAYTDSAVFYASQLVDSSSTFTLLSDLSLSSESQKDVQLTTADFDSIERPSEVSTALNANQSTSKISEQDTTSELPLSSLLSVSSTPASAEAVEQISTDTSTPSAKSDVQITTITETETKHSLSLSANDEQTVESLEESTKRLTTLLLSAEDASSKAVSTDESSSSMQSTTTATSFNQTSTASMVHAATNLTTINSSTDILNITSISP